jgi:hypothetical protein
MLFLKKILEICAIIFALTPCNGVIAESLYSQNDYNPDVMIVSGKAALPKGSGSVLENSIIVRHISVDSEFADAMRTDPITLRNILKFPIERSLKNHDYLKYSDVNESNNIIDFSFQKSKIEEFHDKLNIKIVLHASFNQNPECPTIIANGNYVIYKRKVLKAGSRLLSDALSVFIDGSDNLFSKQPNTKPQQEFDSGRSAELAWNGYGEGLSPYDSTQHTKWFAYQKAIQMALTNFLFQVRPMTQCNGQK